MHHDIYKSDVTFIISDVTFIISAAKGRTKRREQFWNRRQDLFQNDYYSCTVFHIYPPQHLLYRQIFIYPLYIYIDCTYIYIYIYIYLYVLVTSQLDVI